MTHRLLVPAASLMIVLMTTMAAGEPLFQSPREACTPGPRNAFLDGGYAFRSPETLIDGAAIIVEALVQSMQPAAPQTNPPRGPRENDVVLIATRVLKGPDTLQQFATSQIPASGFFEMQTGQHFILFLNELNAATLGRYAERPGVPRYGLRLDSILCVDAGNIRISDQGSYLRTKFEGVAVEKVVSDIRNYLNTPRLNGRLVIEGGKFPPQGVANIPVTGTRDWRTDFRIVLQPVAANSGIARTGMAVMYPPSTSDGSDSSLRIVRIEPTGTFVMPLQPGAYQAKVDGLPFGYYVKAITYGSQDISRESFRIEGSPASDFQIVLTTAAPAGTAVTRVGGRITGIPQDVQIDRIWVALSSNAFENVRASAVHPMADGRFEFATVPSGSYTLRVVPVAAAPPGTVWGGQSIAPVVVADQEVTLDLPVFAGVPVTAHFVDASGNTRSVTPAGSFRLAVQSVGAPNGTPVNLIPAPDGSFRMWLMPGDYNLSGTVTGPRGAPAYSIRAISSGSVDLLKTQLKIDGRTPVQPILITIE